MHRRRRITMLMLLAVTALVCFVLRTESFTNITSSSTTVEEEVLLNDEVIAESPKEITPVNTEIITPVMSSSSESAIDYDEVPNLDISTTSTKGACFIGGCSSQICSDQVDMASTCEWREEYACYQKSICERQPTRECGWRKTPELMSCLVNSNNSVQ